MATKKHSTAPNATLAIMDNVDNSTGAPAQAVRHAAVFKTPEALAEWLLGLVQEWKARDNKVYAVAEGGHCAAEKPSVEASIFEVIEDQVSDTFFATNLKAGIERMQKLVKAEQEAVHG